MLNKSFFSSPERRIAARQVQLDFIPSQIPEEERVMAQPKTVEEARDKFMKLVGKENPQAAQQVLDEFFSVKDADHDEAEREAHFQALMAKSGLSLPEGHNCYADCKGACAGIPKVEWEVCFVSCMAGCFSGGGEWP